MVSNVDRSVDTHCLYCTSSIISLSINTFNCSLNVDLWGQLAQSPMWQASRGGLHVIWAKPCLYDLSGMSSNVSWLSLAPIHINLTFWCTVHTHTECVPLAPARTHSLGRRSANLEKPICAFPCFVLNDAYTSRRLQRIRRFCTCIRVSPIFTDTKSFMPGITRLISSDLYHSFTSSTVWSLNDFLS